MTARAIAVQGVGSPPMALATHGFRGVAIIVPGFVIWVREEVRSITVSGGVRRVLIPEEARVILIPPDLPPTDLGVIGVISIPAEVSSIRVLDDPRLILIPEEP